MVVNGVRCLSRTGPSMSRESPPGMLLPTLTFVFVDNCRRISRPASSGGFSGPVLILRLLPGVLLQLHRLLPEYLLQDHQIQILLLQRDQGRGSHVQGSGLPGWNSHRERYSSQGHRGIFSTPIKLGSNQYLFLE